MIQVKIFEGNISQIQEDINSFLHLSNIKYIDIKILCETKIILIYDLFEKKEVKSPELIVHIGTKHNLYNNQIKKNESE